MREWSAAQPGCMADAVPSAECGKTIAAVNGGRVVYSVCRARFFGRHSFRSMCRHRRTARIHWPNTCGVCLRSVSDRDMDTHRAVCLAAARQCPLCEYTGSGEAIERHICAEHGEEVAKVHATRRRVDHRASVRTQPKRFKCRVCGAAFVNRANLARHAEAKCVYPPTSPKTCADCGQEFFVRRFFGHHVRTHCIEDRPPDVGGEAPVVAEPVTDMPFVCPL